MTNKSLFNDIPQGDDLLVMKGITKIFPNGVIANNNVNFTVKKGEIHGLIGENGAGKTTLMKVLFGQEIPEEGTIDLAGQKSEINSPLAALDYGIGMVHQHFMLVDSLTVAENMVLGREPQKNLQFDYEKAIKSANEVSAQYELPINPESIVRDLSVGYKQRVEILKMLLHGAKILLLDEPTAVLTPQETEELFIQLKELSSKGFSIVFISHKLDEVKELCDRITVLRDGESVTSVDIKDVTVKQISNLMVGHDTTRKEKIKKSNPGKVMLSVRNLTHKNNLGLSSFEDISFDIREGEILGVAAVEGNGQSELSDVLAGLSPSESGNIIIDNQQLSNSETVRDFRDHKISVIHEDRMTYGASLDQNISENIVSTRFHKSEYQKKGFINWDFVNSQSDSYVKEFKIKANSHNDIIRNLSGGNIQKVVVAREFTDKPKLLIASQPTRGVDIGAAELIRDKMLVLRDNLQTAILLFSADLGELLSTSDSIIVMYKGEITAYFPDVSIIDEKILGEYMLGIKKQTEEEIGRVIHEKI